MIKYFKRTDGNYSCIDESSNPSYQMYCSLNYKEISKEEYDKATFVPEPEFKPTYEQLVQDKLITKGYDINRQIAIICNKDRDDEHMKEFEEMQKVREECKAAAKKEIKKWKV